MKNQKLVLRLFCGVVAAAMLAVGCSPIPADPIGGDGPQRVAVAITGADSSLAEGVFEPGFAVKVTQDGLLEALTGRVSLRTDDGNEIIVTAYARMVFGLTLGNVEVSNVGSGQSFNSILQGDPPVRVERSADGTWKIRIVALWAAIAEARIVEGSVTLEIGSADATFAPEVGKSVRAPAVDSDQPLSAMFEAPAGELSLHVGPERPGGTCPTAQVLDMDGAELNALSGCGTLELIVPTDGPYTLKLSTDGARVPRSVVTLSVPVAAGQMALDGPALAAPQLLPGQRARWATQLPGPTKLTAAAWSTDGRGTAVSIADPTFSLIADSGPSTGDRAAVIDSPIGGEFTVAATNESDSIAPPGAILARVASVADQGDLPTEGADAPGLAPGAGVRWLVDVPTGGPFEVRSLHGINVCASLAVSPVGESAPAERVGCDDLAVRIDGPGQFDIRLLNTGTEAVPAGALKVVLAEAPPAVPASIGDRIVGLKVPQGGEFRFDLPTQPGQKVRVQAFKGCVGLELRDASGSLASDRACQPDPFLLGDTPLQSVAVEADAPGTLMQLAVSGDPDADSTIDIEIDSFVDLPAQPSKDAPVAVGAVPVGSRGVVVVGDGPGWQANLVEMTAVAGAGCVHVDLLRPEGLVRPVPDLCEGQPLTQVVVAEGESRLRFWSDQAIPADVIAVTATAQSLGDESAGAGVLRAGSMANLSQDNENAVNQACQQYLIVGLRGSGETTGFGGRVWTAVNEMRTRLGANNIALVAIERPDYPSADVPKPSAAEIIGIASGSKIAQAIAVASFLKKFGPYIQSLASGSDALYETLQRRAHCGETTLLVGYSQGAMAVHRTLIDLQTNGQTAILDRIAGAVLIADGDRHRDDVMRTYGSAGRLAHGVTRTFSMGSARPQIFGNALGSKVFSVCNARDIVCDHVIPISWASGTGTHTDTYQNSQIVRDAAKDASTRARVKYYDAHGWPVLGQCNEIRNSGGEGTTVTSHAIGATRGVLRFWYDAYSVPDKFTIQYEGRTIYTTGSQVSGSASVDIPFGPGSSTSVTVTVNGPSGTAWDYTLSCPT